MKMKKGLGTAGLEMVSIIVAASQSASKKLKLNDCWYSSGRR